jgi:hypothetical protein
MCVFRYQCQVLGRDALFRGARQEVEEGNKNLERKVHIFVGVAYKIESWWIFHIGEKRVHRLGRVIALRYRV